MSLTTDPEHTAAAQAHAGSTPSARLRRLDEVPGMIELAVDLLRTPNALVVMSDEDARFIAAHMQLVMVQAGQVMIREGDSANTGYMLLLLSGEARVESSAVGVGSTIDISVIGPGNIIGEMGVLDGGPRSTTCTAISDVQAAGISRRAVQMLIESHPSIGAHFMVAMAKRLSDRLRALGEQLGMYAQITR